jgi:oligopeptide transport system ATP-binding protein
MKSRAQVESRSTSQNVLEVKDLKIHFHTTGGPWARKSCIVRAVDGVSFHLQSGETLGIVGESGCGKSTTARAILNLVKVTDGQVILNGVRLDNLSARTMHPHRKQIQMIFQDPYASLNPRMPVGRLISEPMKIFKLYDRRTRMLEVIRLMELVGLDPGFMNRYPHEFSGGQRQRIGIARALAVKPQVIICDEPVSALDVSIQAQVINLLMDLQQQLGLAYVFISHDLSVVRHIAHRVAVMYLGKIIEIAPSELLYQHPKHPYTQALLSAVPLPDPQAESKRDPIALVGEVPSPDQIYQGCPFANRCPIAEKECTDLKPALEGALHSVACIKA